MSKDARIIQAMMEQRMNDKSYTGRSFLFFSPSYTQADMRETWFQGIEYGMEKGLHMASLEGQRIHITNNIKNPRHKEFYEKFIDLAKQYNCAIQYHPQVGMCVTDLNYEHE